MKKLICALTLWLASATVAPAAEGTITMTFDLSAHDRGSEAKLWIPYPLSGEDQTISGVTVSGDAAGWNVQTDPAGEAPMLYAWWPGGATSRKLSVAYRVKRREVVRRGFPAVGSIDRREFGRYLAATSLGPVTGEIGDLAARITAGKDSVAAKARAIYDWTCENTYRDPATRGCGKGDVCEFLKKPGGKCADISSVFVALCRAAGVPAREVFGLRLGKKDGEDITGYQHCWAEFYAPGYGWVPADPADVRKAMLVEGLKSNDPRTAAHREYFWGGLDGLRVALGMGRDLTLNPPQAGPPVNYLMYPFAQVGGKTLDWLDPGAFTYSIRYQTR